MSPTLALEIESRRGSFHRQTCTQSRQQSRDARPPPSSPSLRAAPATPSTKSTTADGGSADAGWASSSAASYDSASEPAALTARRLLRARREHSARQRAVEAMQAELQLLEEMDQQMAELNRLLETGADGEDVAALEARLLRLGAQQDRLLAASAADAAIAAAAAAGNDSDYVSYSSRPSSPENLMAAAAAGGGASGGLACPAARRSLGRLSPPRRARRRSAKDDPAASPASPGPAARPALAAVQMLVRERTERTAQRLLAAGPRRLGKAQYLRRSVPQRRARLARVVEPARTGAESGKGTGQAG
jgi:hypothetical protein